MTASLFWIVFSLSASLVFAQKENATAQFFRTAERQLESKKQCLVLQSALTDLGRLPPRQLRLRRYIHHVGEDKTKVDLFSLLKKHYVTEAGKGLSSEALLKSYQEEEARSAIQKALTELGDCGSYS